VYHSTLGLRVIKKKKMMTLSHAIDPRPKVTLPWVELKPEALNPKP